MEDGLKKINLNEGSLEPEKVTESSNEEVLPTQVHPKQNLKRFKITALVLLIIVVLCGLSLIPVYLSAKKLLVSAKEGKTAFEAQDIGKIKNSFAELKKDLTSFSSSLSFVFWAKPLPVIGKYISDAGHASSGGIYLLDAAETSLTTTEPYLGILAIGNGNQAEDGFKTTQERIDFIVSAIPVFSKQMDGIGESIGKAKEELSFIDPDDYPEEFRGVRVKDELASGLSLFSEGASFALKAKPILESAPYLLGMDEERTYLVIFQNDKELRPTGGFITAYSIMKVKDARAEPVRSDDIYNLDTKYKPKVPAPLPIVKYIKGPYVGNKNLRLRDMNWDVDFEKSMDLFSEEIKKVGLSDIDGIIAVDTQLLVNLLDVLGEIGVPGFGNFSTKIDPRCNCPQVIYELESFADVEGPIVWDPNTGKIVYKPPNADNRKRIIGPLVNSILANALGSPKEKIPNLAEAIVKSVFEKHVLLYSLDDKAQSAASSFGIGGKIEDGSGDYLFINDANLGGRKSNLYVTQEVQQEIKKSKDGRIEKAITITYKNPEKHDGWLNSVLPNWTRVYVPLGSELLEHDGLLDFQDPYEEYGKTVFAGFFTLRPEGVQRITLKYLLPKSVSSDFQLAIQKQPGVGSILHTIVYPGREEEFILATDKAIRIKL